MEMVEDTNVEVISLTREGLKYGFPIFNDNELVFIKISDISNLDGNIIYSNHPKIDNLEHREYVFPINPFVNRQFNPILSFIIVDYIDNGYVYLLGNDEAIKAYGVSTNRWNSGGLNNSFIGDSSFLKSQFSSKYNTYIALFCVLVLLGILISIALVNFCIKYQIDKRYDDIAIRHVFFVKNANIYKLLLIEYLVVIVPVTIIGVLIVSIIESISVIYPLMLFISLVFIYIICFILSVKNKIKNLKKRED